MRFKNALASLVLSLAAAGSVISAVHAGDLVIGRATEQSALDPHFANFGQDSSTAESMFDGLARYGTDYVLRPELATSWKLIDPNNWEIKLRAGVKFHDGTPFTAKDVVFSINRAKDIPKSPGPYSTFVRSVAELKIVDDLTLLVRTKEPTPLLMEDLGRIFIVPAHLGEGVTTADFNAGKAVIGTGPYKFQQAIPGDKVVMVANPNYWGDKPAFGTVTLKFISNDAARSAALLSGGVDVIERIPPADIPTLEKRKDVGLFSTASGRIIYLAVDSARDTSPFVTDLEGKAMDKNPLKDRRVRIALSKMINRDAIVNKILAGSAEAAGQIVPQGMGGYDPKLKPEAFDPKDAKKLLADAGYPKGFGLTLHGSKDRVQGDADITQAIGQMFARGGIKMNAVEVFPYSIYAPAATQRKYSIFLFSYGNSKGDSSAGLIGIVGTYNKEAGIGQLNRTRYSNPELDALLAKAVAEFDKEKRDKMLADATRIAIEDGAIIPLLWQKLFWASRKGFKVDANWMERTSTRVIQPAG
jgi:peptide/nickel transport system substrate-binding protein